MPVSFTWEFNPASVIALIGGAATVVAFWLRSSDVAKQSLQEARDAQKRADQAHESIALLQAAISSYREVQAERLVSREVLREVEDRLAGSIDRLGDRLDNLVKELVMGDRRRPPS